MSDFKAKMHQNPKFGWGSAADPAGGAYSTPQPPPPAGFRGPTSKGRGWEGSVVESKNPKNRPWLRSSVHCVVCCFSVCLICVPPPSYRIYFILLRYDIACLCWKCRWTPNNLPTCCGCHRSAVLVGSCRWLRLTSRGRRCHRLRLLLLLLLLLLTRSSDGLRFSASTNPKWDGIVVLRSSISVTSTKEVMFSVFTLLVCLLAGLCKTYSSNFHRIRWKGCTREGHSFTHCGDLKESYNWKTRPALEIYFPNHLSPVVLSPSLPPTSLRHLCCL